MHHVLINMERVEHERVVKYGMEGNIIITFLATDLKVTLNSAIKHLSKMREVDNGGEMGLELSLLIDLLSGKMSKLRQIIGQLGQSQFCGQIVETINALEEVFMNLSEHDQERVIKQAFLLVGHIFEEITQKPSEHLDGIEWAMGKLTNKGIYDDNWIKEIIDVIVSNS